MSTVLQNLAQAPFYSPMIHSFLKNQTIFLLVGAEGAVHTLYDICTSMALTYNCFFFLNLKVHVYLTKKLETWLGYTHVCKEMLPLSFIAALLGKFKAM